MKIFSLLIITLLSTSLQALELSCLQSPSRTKPCPNLMYRSVLDEESQARKMVCFCKIDIEQLLKRDVTNKQAILNKMKLKQLLAENNLTRKQLKSWLNN